ncbi:hypothetical protein K443DRAFT_653832 [Laccaria amethystina LaAM-08-1]|uniref:Uncharacterized protein n=1 Tax=Laccaria amethystina LaAM-08-1 TaxID=1095629 RepID=A0A0C9WTI6_9AGAR|nr:hypothetical protein K443DRAFT_653832 [Laccaria amethystina LaAM-08-1]
MSIPHPPSSRPTPSASHLPPPLSHFIYLSDVKRPEPFSPARTHSLLNFQLFLHHHRPSHRSNTPPSLTQRRPYLASRPPKHSHADATVP